MSLAEETKEKRDWVGEAVQCFIKDATDIDPTDPVKAVAAYFKKNATDELKARCKAEGKDAALCWKFIEAVARKALNGHNGHIDPAVVYAIAKHYFEDVPVNWDGPTGKVAHTPRASEKAEKAKKETKVEKLERKVAQSQVSPARKPELRKELAEAKRKERAKATRKPELRKELAEAKRKERAKAKQEAKKPKQQQGFFFDLLEPQTEKPEVQDADAH